MKIKKGKDIRENLKVDLSKMTNEELSKQFKTNSVGDFGDCFARCWDFNEWFAVFRKNDSTWW